MLATIDQGARVTRKQPYAAADPSYKRLAAAVIVKAVQDAAGMGNVSEYDQAAAAGWLMSDAGVMFCELTGFDHRAVSTWVRAGCPAAPILAADKRKRKGVA